MSVFKTPGSLATKAGFHEQLMDPFFREQYKARTGREIILEGGGEGEEQQEGWLSRTLNNPDVQRLMAGIGSRMDPGGMGEHIGEPTAEMIESKAQQEFMAALMEQMGGAGGKIKIGPDGSLSIDMNANIPETGDAGARLKTYDMRQVGDKTPKETMPAGAQPQAPGSQRDVFGLQDRIRNLLTNLTPRGI